MNKILLYRLLPVVVLFLAWTQNAYPRQTYSRAQYKVARESMQKGRITKAIRYFQKSIWNDPLCPEPYYELGQIYKSQGEQEKYLGYSRLAIKHNLMKDADMYYVTGLDYWRHHEPRLAIFCFYKAGQIQYNHDLAFFAMARAYHALGRTDEEMAWYRHTIRINPNFAPGYYYLALAHEKIGEKKLAQNQISILKAKGLYEQAISYVPEI